MKVGGRKLSAGVLATCNSQQLQQTAETQNEQDTSTASPSRLKYSSLDIAIPPNCAVTGLSCWMSNKAKPRARKCSTRWNNATLEALLARWNMDSPANRPPTTTPYTPPTRRPFCQHSML